MDTKEIYQSFKQKSGSEVIAGLETLETITAITKKQDIKNVLELGAGIGTISYCILANSNAHIDLYEPNEFCISELTKNLSEFKGRYTVIEDYRMLPPRRNYDLVVVDGGGGERNNGSEKRTVLVFLNWLNSVKIIYVQGYRHGQRAFIRHALRDRYVYRIIKNLDGVTFELKRSNSFLAKWMCWLYWKVKAKIKN